MQPELFQDLEATSKQKRFQTPLFPNRFLRVRIAYEDIIFSALSFILVLLAGFCIGVEKGKHLQQNSQTISMAAPLPLEETHPPPPLKPTPVKQVETKAGENYVIQAASFVDNASAQVERERLARKGFNAQIVKQGKFFELRVIGYRSKNDAQISLVNLKKIYRDSFIKRLS